jgi:hypothetical protein
MLSCGSRYTSRMRPTDRSARLAGMRIASATRSGRNLRTERHTDVARRSKAPGMDRWAVLIGHSPLSLGPSVAGAPSGQVPLLRQYLLARSDWRNCANDPEFAPPSDT